MFKIHFVNDSMKKEYLNHPEEEALKESMETTRTRAEFEKYFPISFSQRCLYNLAKLNNFNCARNASSCFKITGNFDSNIFQFAVNTVISRHDAFHATVQERDSEPLLVYNWKTDKEMKILDMKIHEEKAEEVVMEKYQEDYKTFFDLKRGPLVRLKNYMLANNEWLFTMVVHRIICDDISLVIFYNNLWDTYRRYLRGEKVETCLQLPCSFSLAENEIEALKSGHSELKNDLEYWLEKLAGSLPTTTFAGDKRRPEIFNHEGGCLTRLLDVETFEKLKQLVPDPDTLYHSLIGAVFVLILLLNPSETDMIIGMQVSGRSNPDMMSVIGSFTNTLMIRCTINENMSFQNIIEQVRLTCAQAIKYQKVPFDMLVSKFKHQRKASAVPVLGVNVCYYDEEIRANQSAPPEDITVQRRSFCGGTSTRWDVKFDFIEGYEGLRFTLEYYKGLMSDKYALYLADTFQCLVGTLAQNCHLMISDLQKKTPALEISVLHGRRIDHGQQTISELLIKRLDMYPRSVISDFDGNIHSYEDLLRDGFRMAMFLASDCGLKKGDRVGLLFENSYEGLCVIIACLISGLVYVPLNREHPIARLEVLTTDSCIRLLCFSKSNIAIANHLHWSCQQVDTIFCIDSTDVTAIIETTNTPLNDTELWNYFAEVAETDIERGGWMSSYTGEYMTVAEIDEFKSNVYIKLQDFLRSHSSVLEIGCASGFTAEIISAHVSNYVATDMSENMVKHLKEKAWENVEVICTSAVDIGQLSGLGKFDIIILNSVVHCFPGHNYLRKVLRLCEGLLMKDGVLFVGDVMDLKTKDQLVASLVAFKEAHPEKRTKLDWHSELFLPKDFFYHYKEESSFLSVVCSKKISKIENELTKYRYDVIMSKKKLSKDEVSFQSRRQFLSVEHLYNIKLVEQYDAYSNPRNIEPDDDVYILYTSGTTGCPKGVKITQKSVLNYSLWASEAYSLDTCSKLPLFSPLTFDFTVTCIIPPLLCGSTIEIHRPFKHSYEDMMKSKTLTVAKFSPIQIDTILSAATHPLNISTFIIGGEELTFTLIEKLKKNKKEQPFEIWNEYGPTEATVGCVARCIKSNEISNLKHMNIPIGRPINNVSVAVIQENKAVCVGAKGCLAIGGNCLTSGFVNRQSQDNFKLACWNSMSQNELMYITSDIVSVVPSKNELVFFGRNSADFIKIDDMIVDILELQNTLEGISFVQSAWVSTFSFRNRSAIGAAVKLFEHSETRDGAWRKRLIQTLSTLLPFHYLPKVLVYVSRPPTNENGKKDTALLQSLFTSEIENPSTASLDGINKKERMMQRLWRSVLPFDRLPNVEDDFFFDLSGDSIHAILLVRKLRNAGYSVTVNDIYRHRTIKKLLVNVQEKTSITYDLQIPTAVPFRPAPIAERYMLGKGVSDIYSMPALLMFNKNVGVELVQRVLHCVISKHRSLASRFYLKNGEVFQEYVHLESNKPQVDMSKIVLGGKSVTENRVFTEKLVEMECKLNLENGELLNATIFNAEDGNLHECFCLIVLHHIVTDIVSWQHILEEICIAIRQITLGSEAHLPPHFTSYDSYCKILWKEGELSSENEVKFWQNQKVANNFLKMNNKLCETSKYKSAGWVCRKSHATDIRSTSFEAKCSEEVVILTAFSRALSLQLSKENISVCLVNHGRHLHEHCDATNVVGWCTSMFPFHIKIDVNESFVSSCKTMRDSLSCIPQHGLNYGVLERLGKIQTFLPDTLFAFLGYLDIAKNHVLDCDLEIKYTPWIEIMAQERKHGRFHRDENDNLDFPFQILCWYFNDNLNIGCKFDHKIVNRKLVEDLLIDIETKLVHKLRK